MIKSMTGFGRCEVAGNSRKFTVEIKAVNHRYLDMSIKMPKVLNFFEAAIRSELKKHISRGKVDVFVSYEDFSDKKSTIYYNRETAAEYLKHLRRMAEDFGLEDDVRVSVLSRFPEVFTMEDTDTDEDEMWKELQQAVEGAADMFVKARVAEGGNLREDLMGKLAGMKQLVAFVSERSPRIVEEYRQRLEERVREILGNAPVDEGRLLTEVTVFADKVCVDEELVRLRSHIEATEDTLRAGGSVGRKLDFIAQEMNREANTILSKASDLETSNAAIELKTEIEKIREQIQNIE